MLARFLLSVGMFLFIAPHLRAMNCLTAVDRARVEPVLTEDDTPSEVLMAQVRDFESGEAFAVLFRRYSRLMRYLVVKGTNGLDPDEVAQEVWLKIFLDRRTFLDGNKFNYWFPMVVGHALTDEARKFKRQKRNGGNRPESLETVLDGEIMEIILCDHKVPSPPSAAAKAEANHQLHAALASLTPDEHEFLRLYYLEDFNLTEIGERYGESRKWATGRVRNAERALRAKLALTQRPEIF